VPVTILVTLDLEPTAYLAGVRQMARADGGLPAHRRDARAAVQMALIPVASLYKVFDTTTGLQVFGSVIGAIIFHVAFGLPFGSS